MSFNNEYKDFSNFAIPIYYKTWINGQATQNRLTFNNQTISYNSFFIPGITYPSGENMRGIPVELPTSETIIGAIKSKNSNTYLLATISKGANPAFLTTRIRINNKYSLSGSIELTFVNNDSSTIIGLCLNFNNNGMFFCALKGIVSSQTIQSVAGCGISKNVIDVMLGEVDSKVYSSEYGYASDVGGYDGGTFDNSSDEIEIPTMPSVGVTNVGFVNVYKTSIGNLVSLGSELFPNISPFTDIEDTENTSTAIVNGFNNIIKMIANIGESFINSRLIDYVIDCHVIPIPIPSGDSEKIKIGFKEFDISANKVSVDYVDFDCGSISIGEYYNNFIDYVGTRAKLYLPFIGYVPLQNEYFQNGTLNVKYRFNIIDGSFMCYVSATSSKSELQNSVIGMYGGNACVHIPITGLNYSSLISGVVNGGANVIANASGGNVVGAISGAVNTMSVKPQMQSSNAYNSTSAFLGVRRPYLIIEREVSNFSEFYPNEKGLPCNITQTIKNVSGFIQMDNCHMETLTCTEEEKNMIQELLSNGIIV